MARSWRDFEAQSRLANACDNSDNSDVSSPGPLVRHTNVTNVTNVRSLPSDLQAGLVRLQAMSAPRITRPQVWPEIVSDALRLASEGWAPQAIALGWGPLDLWGCSPDGGGNPDHEGLALWLDGRRILLLDERTCIVDAGAGARVVFTRRPFEGAVLLWEIAGVAR